MNTMQALAVVVAIVVVVVMVAACQRSQPGCAEFTCSGDWIEAGASDATSD